MAEGPKKQPKVIEIKEINNGFIVSTKNSIFFDGERVFYGIDDMKLIEYIGKIIKTNKFWRLRQND